MGNRLSAAALRAVPAIVVGAGLFAAPIVAGAANTGGPGRPVRTLSFDVDVHVLALRETPGEGIHGTRPAAPVKGRMAGGRPGGATGSGDRTQGAAVTAKGSIGIDVIAATDDAGLVVDVSESAIERTRPKVRIVLGPDGAVFYDPKNAENLTEEEITLVRWLARGFYGDHPTEPGTTWTVDQSANGHVDVERYRVVARDREQVTLDYALEEKVGGTTGYMGTRGGSLVYDTAMIVPLKATFQTEARRQVGVTYETTRTSVTLTLTADSFAKRR
jgi:hypothetical protein